MAPETDTPTTGTPTIDRPTTDRPKIDRYKLQSRVRDDDRTPTEIAYEAGMAATYLASLMYRVKDNPSRRVLRRLAGVLGCNIEDFYEDAA